jgi:hypothetical protein
VGNIRRHGEYIFKIGSSPVKRITIKQTSGKKKRWSVAAASGYLGRIPAQIFPTVSQQEIYCALYKGKGSENNRLMNGISHQPIMRGLTVILFPLF